MHSPSLWKRQDYFQWSTASVGVCFSVYEKLGPNGRTLVYRPRGSFIQTMKVGGPAPRPLSLMQPCDLKRLKTVRHWGQGRDLRQDKDLSGLCFLTCLPVQVWGRLDTALHRSV